MCINKSIEDFTILVSQTIAKNTECLVAHFIRENPDVPIKEINIVHHTVAGKFTISVQRLVQPPVRMEDIT